MSIKRTEVAVTVKTYGGVAQIDLPAYCAGPGLVVNRDVTIDDGAPVLLDTWAITHVESGRRVVGRLPKREQALVIAAKIQRIRGVKWTAPFAGGQDPYTFATFGPEGLGKRVRRITEQIVNGA